MFAEQKILVVDDHQDSCDLIRMMFGHQGFLPIACYDSSTGLDLARKDDFDAIILDYRMPDKNGDLLCREIRQFNAKTPIIFYTAEAYQSMHPELISAGAQAVLVKPNDLNQLVTTVQRLINNSIAA